MLDSLFDCSIFSPSVPLSKNQKQILSSKISVYAETQVIFEFFFFFFNCISSVLMKSRSHLTFGLFSFQFDSTHYPAVFSAFHVLLKLQDSDQDFIASFAKVGFVDGDSGFRHRQRFDGRFFPGQTTLDDVFGNVVNIFFPLSAVACIQSVYGRNLLKKKKTNMSSRFRLFLLRGEGSLP